MNQLVHRMQLRLCSFDDERARSSALLQLGDILRSIPEFSALLSVLGEDVTRERVVQISQSLNTNPYSDTDLEVLVMMRSLLECHSSGLRICQSKATTLSDEELREWISSFMRTLEYLS